MLNESTSPSIHKLTSHQLTSNQCWQIMSGVACAEIWCWKLRTVALKQFLLSGESHCQRLFLTKAISVKTEATQLHRYLDTVLLLFLFDEALFHVPILGTEISPVFLEKK